MTRPSHLFRGFTVAGCEPNEMGIGPVYAIPNCSIALHLARPLELKARVEARGKLPYAQGMSSRRPVRWVPLARISAVWFEPWPGSHAGLELSP
ncbi:MAG: hypothetical protein A3I63_05060 [Betaproteobacteria bacterium RIFCSPLOWO2_02_FULL_66_14]|nr:MAG: hypothetical protein A3I63_05060 [Betaproteobacteria bacterium RIFCSPLOWO2_02_FULL_66_14]